MDGIWLKFLILSVPVLVYLLYSAIKIKSTTAKFYKEYKKVEGHCSDIKYLRKEIESEEEGSYDLFIQSYILTYSVDGVEYKTNRKVESADNFGHALMIHKGDDLDIWVNPDNKETVFVPKFDDYSANSMASFIVVSFLFMVCALIINGSL